MAEDDDAANAADRRPTDEEVVEAAAAAAEGVVFDRYKQSRVDDLDLTVSFEDGVLEVDVYVDPPADADVDPDEVVAAAVEAAGDAVDDLFAASDRD
ncbi:MAG: DUF3194 domain-containing protein [Haloferacaceae archaeon]